MGVPLILWSVLGRCFVAAGANGVVVQYSTESSWLQVHWDGFGISKTPKGGSYFACGGKIAQSLVAVRTFIFTFILTAASDSFLLPRLIAVFAWQVQHFKA